MVSHLKGFKLEQMDFSKQKDYIAEYQQDKAKDDEQQPPVSQDCFELSEKAHRTDMVSAWLGDTKMLSQLF